MSDRPAKLRDVAEAAGVSTATVSRALSQPELLSDATREAVFEAVRATGYRVNRAARNLRRQEAGAVLVLVPNLGNPFFSQILSGISAGFAASDRSVLITDSSGADRSLSDYFRDGRIDGVISLDGGLPAEDLAFFSAYDRRVVFACEWAPGAGFHSVRSDNAAGAALAIRHLLDLGHRRIAHVAGPVGNVLTDCRRDAALAALAAGGVESAVVIDAGFSLDAGAEAGRRILAMAERPTAVFCASDEIAIGLISALAEAGIDVPGDMSVVGFDDIELARHYRPPLTTIRQNRPELGRRAARRLLGQLDGRRTGEAVETVGVSLVARASAAVWRG